LRCEATSAVGGWAAGVLFDRYGRVRILQLTVLATERV
jgi:MFS family permease